MKQNKQTKFINIVSLCFIMLLSFCLVTNNKIKNKAMGLLETGLLGKGNTEVPKSVITDAPVVAVYFCANWVPPCRSFTPILAKWYKEQKANGKKFEIIFVSSDRDEESFKSYFAQMPWVALPFGDTRSRILKSKSQVSRIPKLSIIDKEGNMLHADGRADVTQNPAGAIKKWTELSEKE